MKKMLTVSLLVMSASVFSMEANQLKENDLQACERQALTLPEDQQSDKKKLCECKVNNKDYEAVAEAREAGDMDKLRELNDKAAAKCEA